MKELKNFIFENYYIRFGFAKESSYYSMKHQKKQDLQLIETKLMEKIPDATNAKQYYQSCLHKTEENTKKNTKEKNIKLFKRSKIVTEQPNTFSRSQTISHLQRPHKYLSC